MSDTGAIVDTIERMFPEPLPAERSRVAWETLCEGGFAWVGVDESSGGSGGELADATAIITALAARGVSVPIAESTLLAGWLLGAAGLPVEARTATTSALRPDDHLVLSRSGTGWTLSGRLTRVPWLSWADDLVVPVDLDGALHVVRVPVVDLSPVPGSNLAGEPRESVEIAVLALPSDAVAPAPAEVSIEALRTRGALARAAAISGALATTLEMTVRYTTERVQFGRPISRFQAVQHHLVRLAGEAAQAQAATALAIAAHGTPRFDDAVAIAKLIASEAVGPAAAAAHQTHGAIGVTREYDLQVHTRAMWSWRHEYGSGRQWARAVGATVVERGADALWDMVTDTLAESGVGVGQS